MPSYVFDARRAYFTVLRMTTDPFMPLLERHAPPDLQVAQTSARRLELLASMMAEMFAKDERNAARAVPTRSRPQIWEHPEEFGRAIDAFTAATRALSTSTGSRDPGQLRAQFLKVEYACAKCHEKFRRGGNDNVGTVSP
jgi:cytochrome c556